MNDLYYFYREGESRLPAKGNHPELREPRGAEDHRVLRIFGKVPIQYHADEFLFVCLEPAIRLELREAALVAQQPDDAMALANAGIAFTDDEAQP